MSGGKLPEGWQTSSIGDLCKKVTDGSHNPPKVSEAGLPMLSAKNINNGSISFSETHRIISESEFWEENKRTNIESGDVLLTIVGTLGRTAVVPQDFTPFTLQRSVAVMSTSEIEPSYFRYALENREFQIQIHENAKGTAQKGIYLNALKKLTINIAPKKEQKIIAEKLDTLLVQVDSTRARLEQIPQILKRFRQAVLASAVNGWLTKKSHPNGILGVQTSLGELILNGPQNGLYKSSKFYGEGVKIIRIDSFYDGKILSWDKLKKVDINTIEKNRWQLHENDILINRVNSIEYLGKCAHVKMLSEDVVFESNIMRFSIDTTKISPEYLTLFLCSASGIKELRKNAKLAVNQASINQTDVKNCKLILPTLTEQVEIVRRVEQLFAYADTIEKQVNSALTRINNLTQSILAKAFRGELTAQWRAENPDLISGENSAAALLERIKAERAATGGKKTSRKKS
ncbi:restriction endonuclease subunit S [Enterobacter soli]|uniref:restriction endonuclease subunit S n=1 Tax=Enterobacter soli TaxID=885040 RepID=UPI002377F957|nr:restriction endonuclease subunit S [Enterobacter soli]MDD9243003.1 restriction endonuclease subunit S [Enterobacter soli]